MSDQIPPDGTGKDVEVLAVEDDEERRCLLTRLLQGHGYAATGACRANRHVVDEHAARYLALAERRDTLLGLICLDLARFKEINDRFGHPGGDNRARRGGPSPGSRSAGRRRGRSGGASGGA